MKVNAQSETRLACPPLLPFLLLLAFTISSSSVSSSSCCCCCCCPVPATIALALPAAPQNPSPVIPTHTNAYPLILSNLRIMGATKLSGCKLVTNGRSCGGVVSARAQRRMIRASRTEASVSDPKQIEPSEEPEARENAARVASCWERRVYAGSLLAYQCANEEESV